MTGCSAGPVTFLSSRYRERFPCPFTLAYSGNPGVNSESHRGVQTGNACRAITVARVVLDLEGEKSMEEKTKRYRWLLEQASTYSRGMSPRWLPP